MGDVGIYCKFVNITARAGTRCSAVSNLVTWTDNVVLDAESLVNVLTKKNWSDAYAGLNDDVKYLLLDATACYVAMLVIQYDMSGMPAREAETRLDFLRDCFLRDIKALEVMDIKNFITGA